MPRDLSRRFQLRGLAHDIGQAASRKPSLQFQQRAADCEPPQIVTASRIAEAPSGAARKVGLKVRPPRGDEGSGAGMDRQSRSSVRCQFEYRRRVYLRTRPPEISQTRRKLPPQRRHARHAQQRGLDAFVTSRSRFGAGRVEHAAHRRIRLVGPDDIRIAPGRLVPPNDRAAGVDEHALRLGRPAVDADAKRTHGKKSLRRAGGSAGVCISVRPRGCVRSHRADSGCAARAADARSPSAIPSSKA